MYFNLIYLANLVSISLNAEVGDSSEHGLISLDNFGESEPQPFSVKVNFSELGTI